MTARQAWIAAVIAVAAMAVMTAVAWPLVPPGQPIPIHFRFDGTPNRFAPREFGLLIVPAAALLVSLGMAARRTPSGLGDRLGPAARPAPLIPSVLAVLAGGQGLIIGYALHPGADLLRLFFGALGLLIAVLGAAMSGLQPNAQIGIRTPWTRADPEVWRATHRFGSGVFLLAGIVLAAMAAFATRPASLAVPMLIDVAAAALASALYSYLVYRSRRARPMSGQAGAPGRR